MIVLNALIKLESFLIPVKVNATYVIITSKAYLDLPFCGEDWYSINRKFHCY